MFIELLHCASHLYTLYIETHVHNKTFSSPFIIHPSLLEAEIIRTAVAKI